MMIFLAFCSVVLYFFGPSFLPSATTESRNLHSGTRMKHEKSVYLEDGSLGNYEKSEKPRSGPGEMGKPHRVKPEQKSEEDRLKGINISILAEFVYDVSKTKSNLIRLFCLSFFSTYRIISSIFK